MSDFQEDPNNHGVSPHVQHGSCDYERESSKSKERVWDKERDWERDNGRSRDRDRGRDRDKDQVRDRDHHRDRYKDRSERRERGRGGDDDGYYRGRSERRRDYGRGRDERHKYRSRSPSRSKSEHRSRSHSPSGSRSPSKSKRRSGFDMAPPMAMPTMLTTAPGNDGFAHSADIGSEPTSVAYIFKEEPLHEFNFNRLLLPVLVVIAIFPPALKSDIFHVSVSTIAKSQRGINIFGVFLSFFPLK